MNHTHDQEINKLLDICRESYTKGNPKSFKNMEVRIPGSNFGKNGKIKMFFLHDKICIREQGKYYLENFEKITFFGYSPELEDYFVMDKPYSGNDFKKLSKNLQNFFIEMKDFFISLNKDSLGCQRDLEKNYLCINGNYYYCPFGKIHLFHADYESDLSNVEFYSWENMPFLKKNSDFFIKHIPDLAYRDFPVLIEDRSVFKFNSKKSIVVSFICSVESKISPKKYLVKIPFIGHNLSNPNKNNKVNYKIIDQEDSLKKGVYQILAFFLKDNEDTDFYLIKSNVISENKSDFDYFAAETIFQLIQYELYLNYIYSGSLIVAKKNKIGDSILKAAYSLRNTLKVSANINKQIVEQVLLQINISHRFRIIDESIYYVPEEHLNSSDLELINEENKKEKDLNLLINLKRFFYSSVLENWSDVYEKYC